MIKFSLNQIKFFSTTTIWLLCWQSLALANPNLNQKIKLKKPSNFITQALPENPDVLVPNPSILIDGKPVENNLPSTPPFSRAVAPPVGDISVSNSSITKQKIQFLSDPVINELVLREAPLDEVLSLLARSAGMSIMFDYTDGGLSNPQGQTSSQVQSTLKQPISLDIKGQQISQVFNNLLQLYRFEASQSSENPTMILVSKSLPYSVNNSMSRTLRLNQAKASSVAAQLALMGATSQQIIEEIEVSGDAIQDVGGAQATAVTSRAQVESAATRRTTRKIKIEPISANEEINKLADTPLPLRRLNVTADDRTNSLTLTGTPEQIEIASKFIIQSDLRLRQVAVNVKVVDVQLNQNDSVGFSFSWGLNDTGVVQQGGVGVINFGTNQRNVNPNQWGTIGTPNNGRITPFSTDVLPDQPGRNAAVLGANNFNVPQAFLGQIRANISSGNAKILTDPTIVVQEGQIGTIALTEDVVTGVETIYVTQNNISTPQTNPIVQPAGLTVSVNVDKIDDNGFINLIVNPTVSAPGPIQRFQSGPGITNDIRPLIKRTVSSGLIRLRDGQTLILSGIISDQDRTNVSKVPILGDLPIIGSLFRATFKDNRRSEVIVMLTPQIIDDSQGNSGFGYNYSPSRETGQFLRERGLNVPSNPY